MLWKRTWKKERAQQGALDRAIAEWRGVCPAESLSEATRSRIVRDALRPKERTSRLAPLATLFMPTPRLALGVAAPAILVTFVLGYWLLPELSRSARIAPAGPSAAASLAAQMTIQTIQTVQTVKTEGEVIFIIANGHRSHRVYRSVSADNLLGMEAQATGGTFRDGLEAGPDLVFYRIE